MGGRGAVGLATGLATALAAAVGAAWYVGTVTGAVTVDIGRGRRTRPLGPQQVDIAAPRDTVFALLAQPYLGRATRAMTQKIQVLERGQDMVLASHRTSVGGGLTAVTVETVRFTEPERVDFRLVRGPVPDVVEQFLITEPRPGETTLAYTGELGTDGGALGARWGDVVAGPWERAVADTFAAVKAEAERRTHGSAATCSAAT